MREGPRLPFQLSQPKMRPGGPFLHFRPASQRGALTCISDQDRPPPFITM